jgi:hypothetical protein
MELKYSLQKYILLLVVVGALYFFLTSGKSNFFDSISHPCTRGYNQEAQGTLTNEYFHIFQSTVR